MRLWWSRRAAADRALDGMAQCSDCAGCVEYAGAVVGATSGSYRCGDRGLRVAHPGAHLSVCRSADGLPAARRAVARHSMTALAISNIVLWIVVLGLLAVVLALTRQL